jgi:hypothetical protein
MQKQSDLDEEKTDHKTKNFLIFQIIFGNNMDFNRLLSRRLIPCRNQSSHASAARRLFLSIPAMTLSKLSFLH